PFGTNWFVTADVEHFGKDLDAIDHPAKIVVSGDATWADLSAEDHVCFMGQVSDNESSVFVNSMAAVTPGTCLEPDTVQSATGDRKSTRLNSSHVSISYAVFCLNKKNRHPRAR